MIEEIQILRRTFFRELHTLIVYTTNRCNSRCVSCRIWCAEPKQDIDYDLVARVIRDTRERDVRFRITGGEALLHPEIDRILSLLGSRKYTLFSNGLLWDRVVEAVLRHRIRSLYLSCDGPRATYLRIRGVDGYESVERVLRGLQGRTKLYVNYTISRNNSVEDLRQIVDLCLRYDAHLIIGIAGRPHYFASEVKPAPAYDLSALKIPRRILSYPKCLQSYYLELHNRWLKGSYRAPCLNIRSQAALYPDGHAVLCEAKWVILGDLREKGIRDIWDSSHVRRLQREYRACNGCLLICQRPMDVLLQQLRLDHLFA